MNKYIGYFLLEWFRMREYFEGVITGLLEILIRALLPWTIYMTLISEGKITRSEAYSLLWALIAGQILHKSSIHIYRIIKKDIRTGNIAIRLSEPVNYIGMRFFQSLGFFIPRYIFYSIICFIVLRLVAPVEVNILYMVTFTPFSFLIANLIYIMIGLSSFILEENDGVYLIVGKLFLIFGNQILPVALMPDKVVDFAKKTPFYLAYAGPGEISFGRADFTMSLLLAVIYIVIFWLLTQMLLNKLKKHMILNG